MYRRASQHLTQIITSDSRRLLASLIRVLGDMELAQDCLQDALTVALQKWEQDGIPENAHAWLLRVARNRAIDRLRHDKMRADSAKDLLDFQHQRLLADEDSFLEQSETSDHKDDLLRLIFTCCHPALAQDAQIALTLNVVVGLSTLEIASALLLETRTLEQRLTRAKRKIKLAKIPYQIPNRKQLPERLDSVLLVVYLIFNEGYTATSGAQLVRAELCNQALHLARLLENLFRGEAEVEGLLALLLLQDSRRTTRTDDNGDLIPLEKQARQRWDQSKIAEGLILVEKALRKGHVGAYQIQAAIAALHAKARSAPETDWQQIAALYAELEKYSNTPVVRLNRAVALHFCDRNEQALYLLESLAACKEMNNYAPYYIAQAEVKLDMQQRESAKQLLLQAADLTQNISEKQYLEKRVSQL